VSTNPASHLVFGRSPGNRGIQPRGVYSLRILGIDTSSSAGSILLAEDERILGEICVDSTQTHSSRLLPGIDYLLKSTALDLKDLDGFAVINGPGSFTGLRIGLTTVKALAESCRKPIVAVSTFDAWAEKFHDRQGILVPLIDARRGEVYACAFERHGQELSVIMAASVDKPERILARIAWPDVLFVGDGAHQYGPLIYDSSHPHWNVERSDAYLGRPLARLALQRAREKTLTAEDLQAVYVRKSDAELNWKEK
jgi:tRNA threonylcarbamoyladenosine biosynthesis protein TsaB